MISFDIFDTLITRKTYSPQGIFLLVQERLYNNLRDDNFYFCKNFFTFRINAEKDARLYAKQEGREEISLDEIYDLLAIRNDLSKDLSNRLKEWEIQEEINNIYPIKQNIEMLKNYLAEGKHIILISDMYLDKATIRKILLKADPIFYDIPIYVSSEINKTKYNGSLFFEVARREKIYFSDWIHFGDNRISDYLMPKMLGIDARHIPFEELTLWERELGDKLGLKTNLMLQLYLGIARNVRLENKLNCPGKIGASIGGILLYPYVFWLLRKATEIGIKRLYFIARDGYILKKITDLIISNQHLDIHTKYIYGSRKAWKLNEFPEKDKKKVIAYLSQEVDFSDSAFAFVDLNGTGTTMACLSDAILENFKVKTKVFYFDLSERKISSTYLFIPFCSDYSSIIELFCRAPHGATIGYYYQETKIVPKLQPVDNLCWEKAGLYDYFKGVELFADRMSKCCQEYWLEDIGLVESVLEYCQKSPCQELQDFMGNIPHYDGSNENKITYAPVLSRYDIFKLYMWRTIEDISDYYTGVNLELSLMRSDQECNKEKVFLERHYTSIWGRCIHRIKNRTREYRKMCNIKVIIYGAGNVGKRLYEHLITISEYQVVGWTDMNCECYKNSKYPVITLLESLKKDFDYIIIAMRDQINCNQILRNLVELGVSKEKIITYEDFLREQNIKN